MLLPIRQTCRPQVAARSMTRALLPWAILIVLVTVLPGAWGGEPEIVARVNGEPVNRAELQRMLADPLTRARLRRELGVHAPSNKAIAAAWKRLRIRTSL